MWILCISHLFVFCNRHMNSRHFTPEGCEFSACMGHGKQHSCTMDKLKRNNVTKQILESSFFWAFCKSHTFATIRTTFSANRIHFSGSKLWSFWGKLSGMFCTGCTGDAAAPLFSDRSSGMMDWSWSHKRSFHDVIFLWGSLLIGIWASGSSQIPNEIQWWKVVMVFYRWYVIQRL